MVSLYEIIGVNIDGYEYKAIVTYIDSGDHCYERQHEVTILHENNLPETEVIINESQIIDIGSILLGED